MAPVFSPLSLLESCHQGRNDKTHSGLSGPTRGKVQDEASHTAQGTLEVAPYEDQKLKDYFTLRKPFPLIATLTSAWSCGKAWAIEATAK